MNLLAKVLYGSKLYGTEIATSDLDYRSIYLPDVQDVVLGRAKDAWEDKSEDDTSYFSLMHFARLACEGQSIAVELLAAPPAAVVATSPIWQTLQENRRKFYTKRMHSLLGFSKSISSKYSRRVDRLRETEAVLATFRGSAHLGSFGRLGDLWERLPTSLNVTKTTNSRNSGADKRVYQVCGREIQATVTLDHAISVVQGVHDGYGQRVRNIKEGNIDYKALMHAFRAAYQCLEIAQTGDLQFPLKKAPWLRDLRLGKFDFIENELDKMLDELIAEAQRETDASNLPEEPDQEWVERLILGAYGLT